MKVRAIVLMDFEVPDDTDVNNLFLIDLESLSDNPPDLCFHSGDDYRPPIHTSSCICRPIQFDDVTNEKTAHDFVNWTQSRLKIEKD